MRGWGKDIGRPKEIPDEAKNGLVMQSVRWDQQQWLFKLPKTWANPFHMQSLFISSRISQSQTVRVFPKTDHEAKQLEMLWHLPALASAGGGLQVQGPGSRVSGRERPKPPHIEGS